MYYKEELTGIQCDNCGEIYQDYHTGCSMFFNQSEAMERAYDKGWAQDQEILKHYCPNCHTIDDEDNLIIKPIPPIFEVIAEFPNNNDFPLGKKITFVPWTHEGYWIHEIEDCQGKRHWLSTYFEQFPYLFKKVFQ